MKVSIGFKPRLGPWGGGNQFLHSLSNYLTNHGCQVTYNLNDPCLDIILLTDPREKSLSASFSVKEVINYLTFINRAAIVVHRINECDERKGSSHVNKELIYANRFADHTVFVASWLKNLFIRYGLISSSRSVILNGSDLSVFNSNGHAKRLGKTPLKIISHHWSSNWFKGFDIYEKLDQLLIKSKWRKKIQYTFVGKLPDDFHFINTTYISPKHGTDLAEILRSSHVYLTASRNEPGGHHQNEGANCGLPLLYINSGCMPEYCDGFGVSFTPNNFENKLEEMIETYDYWAEKMINYPHTAEKMCSEYHRLFQDLLDNRKSILSQRKPISKQSVLERRAYHFNEIKREIIRSVKFILRKIKLFFPSFIFYNI